MTATVKEIKKVSNNIFKIDVDASGDIFIVPNHATILKNHLFNIDTKIMVVNEFLTMNGFDECDPAVDKMIEVWIVSDDLRSNNLGDHGFSIPTPGIGIRRQEVVVGNHHFITQSIPEKCIHDMKEGDTRTFSYRLRENHIESADKSAEDISVTVNLNLTITANQQGYRYRNFGKFEDVLRQVCG